MGVFVWAFVVFIVVFGDLLGYFGFVWYVCRGCFLLVPPFFLLVHENFVLSSEFVFLMGNLL